MKKIIIFSIITLFFSLNAQASELKPYISAKVDWSGSNFETQDSDILDYYGPSLGGSVAIGLAFESLPIRTEFEFSLASKKDETKTLYSSTGDIDLDFEVKTQSYFLNFYYDFYNSSRFSPYFGFGLGAITADGSMTISSGPISEKFEEKETSFSWQIATGFNYKLNNNLSTDLGVRFNQTSFDDLGIDSYFIILSLGLRYSF